MYLIWRLQPKKTLLEFYMSTMIICFLEVSKQILLVESEFEIDNAASVDEAFKKIKREHYDVVVSDYELPQKDGLDFLKELRDQNNQIPFILFTGKGREDVAVKALNLGADRYLNKNGSPETVYCELADAINKTVERKKSEQFLMESEEKFRNLAEQSPNMIFINCEGRVVYANKKCEEITGYSRQDFYSPDFNFLSLNPPEYVEPVRLAYAKHMRGETVPPYEYVLITRDGERINAIINTTLIEYNGNNAILGIVTNITNCKKAEKELRKNNKKMEIMNEKLRVICGLTRHDVANKLMIIKANAYLLKKRIGVNPELAKYLEGIDSALDGTDHIIEFGRTYENIGLEQLANMNVGRCFDEAVALFLDLSRKKVINECLDLTVLADSLLGQMFYNFIDNSLKHGEKVTEIKLLYKKEEKQIKLFYEDNGIGIPEANKLKVFEKGFSTGNGSGLGLLLIKKIIEVYGWTITEEGESGKGAKFVITIPEINEIGNKF
jgi:PAS domain S-box-containing protein